MDFIYNIFNCGNNKNNAYDILMKDITELIDKYETYKFDEKGCDTLEILYDDKLMRFKTEELSEILVVGLKYDIPNDKKNNKKYLCNKIIEYFNKRYELLIDISKTVENCIQKLNKIKNGNYCKNIDIYIDNFETCIKNNGEWISQKEFENEIRRIRNNKDLENRNYYVKKLKNDINYHLKLLHNEIIKKIKDDIKNPHDDYYFNNLISETYGILKRIELSSDALFKIIINY